MMSQTKNIGGCLGETGWGSSLTELRESQDTDQPESRIKFYQGNSPCYIF